MNCLGKSVSDLETGERTGSERQAGVSLAAGVAHTLSPTLSRLRIRSRSSGKRKEPQGGDDNGSEQKGERTGERMVRKTVHPRVHPQTTRRSRMPLIQREKKEVFKTIPIRFEESLAERVIAYAEFLESSKDHVVSEAMRYIIDRDKDFAARMKAEQAGNSKAKPKPGKQPTEATAKAGQ